MRKQHAERRDVAWPFLRTENKELQRALGTGVQLVPQPSNPPPAHVPPTPAIGRPLSAVLPKGLPWHDVVPALHQAGGGGERGHMGQQPQKYLGHTGWFHLFPFWGADLRVQVTTSFQFVDLQRNRTPAPEEVFVLRNRPAA